MLEREDRMLQELDKLLVKMKIREVKTLAERHMSEGEEKQGALQKLEKAEQELDSPCVPD